MIIVGVVNDCAAGWSLIITWSTQARTRATAARMSLSYCCCRLHPQYTQPHKNTGNPAAKLEILSAEIKS